MVQIRYRWLVLAVFLCLALHTAAAQDSQPQSGGQARENEAATAQASAPELPADAPVITIEGLCDSGLTTSTAAPQAKSSSGESGPAKAIDPNCKTVVTRQQYEALLGVLAAKPRPDHRYPFAVHYAELLLFSEKGRELGVEKDAKFKEKSRYSYLNDLNQFTLVQMQTEADDISDADAAKYYEENKDRFVRLHLLQIAVPKWKLHGSEQTVTRPANLDPAEEAEMHRLALRIQKEAAAGGDFDKLEEKAYKVAGDSAVPGTDLGQRLPDEVPAEYRKMIFDLNPGQVSEVAEDDHEYLIFKCAEKHIEPPAERKKLCGWLRIRDAREALSNSVKTHFNPQYFPTAPGSNQKQAGESP